MARRREPYQKDCALPLQSDRHPYDKPGTWGITVKVLDILGKRYVADVRRAGTVSTLRVTPAMEAGIAGHVWTWGELLGGYGN